MRGLCTEIIAKFLVHGKPVLVMKVSDYQCIQRRELCAFEGFQREILATSTLCLNEERWHLP